MTRKPAKKPTRDVKLMGAAAINSHLEAIRVALVIYGMDWEADGFAAHWEKQLDRIERDRAMIPKAPRGNYPKTTPRHR